MTPLSYTIDPSCDKLRETNFYESIQHRVMRHYHRLISPLHGVDRLLVNRPVPIREEHKDDTM